MRRMFSILVLAGLLLAATASPALAFHHRGVPARRVCSSPSWYARRQPHSSRGYRCT